MIKNENNNLKMCGEESKAVIFASGEFNANGFKNNNEKIKMGIEFHEKLGLASLERKIAFNIECFKIKISTKYNIINNINILIKIINKYYRVLEVSEKDDYYEFFVDKSDFCDNCLSSNDLECELLDIKNKIEPILELADIDKFEIIGILYYSGGIREGFMFF